MSRTRFWLRLVALTLPIFYLAFLIADRQGVWSRMRGLDRVEAVAKRFDLSYVTDASRPVSVGDSEWEPLIHLIYRYSNADLPKDKRPQVVARFPAPVSGVIRDANQNVSAEWTAPSTLFAVLYRKWPGQEVIKDDYRVVGTIGDLHSWIVRSKDELRFMVKDVFFVIFSFVVGLLLFLHDHRSAAKSNRN